ncbi:MAG: amino acid ABC transporter ATP-binding/permease protein [Gorillibacterium sp.]|nr:amino acid ABC transporter ATP-binding/permease protein [Gorillibacterium sp.]
MKRQGWIVPYLRSNFGSFVGIILLSVLTLLSAGMLMFTSGFLISKSSIPPENILLVYVPIVGVRTFSIARAVLHYVERLVGHNVVLRILSRMRVRLYRVLEPQALFVRSRFGAGDILGVLADDIEQLQNVFIRTIFPSAVAVIMYACVIVALGLFDPGFALLMALYLLILVLVLPLISLKFTKAQQTGIKRERGGLYRQLTDAVLGIGDWMISGRSADFLTAYEVNEQKVTAIDRSLRSFARWRSLVANAIVGLAVISMLFWSAQQFTAGAIPATLIAAFVLVVFPLMDAFLPVSEAMEKIPQYRESVSRLYAIEDEGLKDRVLGQTPVAEEEIRQASLNAHICLDNVSYSYDDHEDKNSASARSGMQERHVNAVEGKVDARGNATVAGHAIAEGDAPVVGHAIAEGYDNAQRHATLAGITLDIPQGKRIAVIGRSGAGKSTLLKLIQGALSPASGKVTINGTDASSFEEQIPKVIAVLNQSPHLFDTSLANNIRLGREDAEELDIRGAAKLAHLEALIATLPEGYGTPMRETGQRFSGGERQRVALARILLQNTPIVILDEPTVGLDPRTERDLLATMFTSLEGKSLIWVTHHLVGVEMMDEVIFMEHGQIVMRGTHAELMQQHERYRNLYRLDRPIVTVQGTP